MSQTQTELRKDQLTLYPMQRELDTEEQMRLKGGLVLWLMGLSVPILLLVEVRYVMVGGYVDPHANPLLGTIGLVLLIISAILTSVAKRTSVPVSRGKVLGAYLWSVLFTLAAFILIGWHVVDHSESSLTHYGMTFVTAVGTADFYVFTLLVALMATHGRVKRLNIRNTWGLSATNYYAWFVVAVWVVIYAFMYFL